MAQPPQLYWDTCVFFAFLNNETEKYAHLIDHIEQFLEEAKQGACTIYTSAVTIAEVPAVKLSHNEYGSFNDFLEDYRGAIIQVGADPNIMMLASEIKGITHTKGPTGRREVGTLDAIHLASALTLSADYGVPITAFHTFDTGKSKTIEGGRAMPLLGYETWCEGQESHPIVSRIIALNRCKPEHDNPRFPKDLLPRVITATSGGLAEATTLTPVAEKMEVNPPDSEPTAGAAHAAKPGGVSNSTSHQKQEENKVEALGQNPPLPDEEHPAAPLT